jgi:hypothetical protein
VGEVVELRPVELLRLGVSGLRELPGPARVGVYGVELVAEDVLELRDLLLERHRRLHDLEDAGLVPDADSAGRGGGLPELAELPHAPVGLEVAGGDDRREDGDAGETIDETVREDVVSLQLRVAPDARVPPQELAEPDLEHPVKARDPPLLAFDERLVVDVGVADEDVVLELHVPSPISVPRSPSRSVS